MRILSLKCANLNSLRGEQPEIRFDRGPLADAGLFAITGPTGTGKTTLLDAITLALYGKVYRFEDEGASLRSEEILNQILTIGTGRCEVEVTFRVEGAAYHAKWACQRAHKKTEGNVQKAEMWLSRIDVDGAQASPYKTRSEVPKEVARLTQLDFGQFVRSVLLPQGAFAQFLKAKNGGRAELLQKLTDTERFAQIGLAAHQRFQQAEKELETADQRALYFAKQLLAPEEQTRLAAEEEAAVGQLTELQQQMAAAQAALTWFEADRKWRLALEDAVRECTESTAAADTAETADLRRALARHQQADPCRDAWDAWRRATEEVRKLTDRHGSLHEKTPPLAAAFAAATPVVALTETAWQTAQQAHADQAPNLRRAEALDAQAATARQLVAEQTGRVQGAEQGHEIQLELLRQEKERLETTRADYKKASDWLASNAADAALTSDALSAPRAACQRAELAAQQAKNLARLDEADAIAAAKLATTLDLNRAQQTRADDQKKRAEAAETTCQVDFGQFLGKMIGHGSWLKTEYQAADLLLDQLGRHHRRLEALHVLPAYRHTLVAGEPCALCGSVDHCPEAMLTASDEEVAASQKTLAGHDDATQRMKARTDALRDAYVQAKAAWPAEVPAPAPAAPANHFIAADEATLPRRVQEFQQHVKAATEARQIAAAELLELAGAARNWQAQRQELTEKISNRQAEREAVEHLSATAMAEVAVFFVQAGQPLADETVGTDLEKLRLRGEAYQQRLREQQTALTTGKQVQETIKTLTTAAKTAETTVHQEQKLFTQRTEQAADLLAQRLRLYPADVQPAAELTRLAGAEKRAFDALETARTESLKAEKAHADHLQAVKLAEQALVDATRACADCYAAWHTHRTTHQLPADADLTTWLIRDAARLEAQRETLRALDERCVGAHKALQLTQDERRAHRTVGPPFASAAAAEAELADLTAAQKAVLLAAGGRQEQLAKHAEAARQSHQNVAALNLQQTETGRWQELKKLIGGADLKSTRFSKFAQTLTLAHLVREANRHLARLAPRYELLPKTDDDELGLWVLDDDHAGTARAVESLSGGETFLVSLALALGLSDLAGYRVQIESLFIDEGFGTLDPETLDTAISALETVQQSGRMVGVISHVAALKERIKTQIQLRKVAGGSRLAVVVEK